MNGELERLRRYAAWLLPTWLCEAIADAGDDFDCHTDPDGLLTIWVCDGLAVALYRHPTRPRLLWLTAGGDDGVVELVHVKDQP